MEAARNPEVMYGVFM